MRKVGVIREPSEDRTNMSPSPLRWDVSGVLVIQWSPPVTGEQMETRGGCRFWSRQFAGPVNVSLTLALHGLGWKPLARFHKPAYLRESSLFGASSSW